MVLIKLVHDHSVVFRNPHFTLSPLKALMSIILVRPGTSTLIWKKEELIFLFNGHGSRDRICVEFREVFEYLWGLEALANLFNFLKADVELNEVSSTAHQKVQYELLLHRLNELPIAHLETLRNNRNFRKRFTFTFD